MHAELRKWCTENLMWLSCELTKVMGPIIGGPASRGAGQDGVGHQIRAPPGANANYMQPPAFSVFFSFRSS